MPDTSLDVLEQPLRVIVFQDDDGTLCAHSVDYALGVHGHSLAELYEEFARLVQSHIVVRQHHKMKPFADLPPAPEKYRQWYERAPVELPTQIISAPAARHRIPATTRILVAKPAA